MTNTQNTLVLRETPNAFTHITGATRLWNGSDGFMYDERDLDTLTFLGWTLVKTRSVKYGENRYYEKKGGE